MAHHMSTANSLSNGSTQGCVLNHQLYTHDCTPAHNSNTIMKFADNTMVVGLIAGEDESTYRDEVEQLTGWCRNNNVPLNATKTKEVILDFRMKKTDISHFI